MHKSLTAIGAGCALFLLSSFSALAQDAMSAEAIEERINELSSRQYSDIQRRGYRERVTASDYELEFQMQQLDKQRAADDRREQDRLTRELGRRQTAREQAQRAAERERWEAQGEASHQQIMGWIKSQNQQLEQDWARLEQQRQRNDQLGAQNRQRSQEGARQAEAFYERSRTRPPPAPRLQPIQPGPAGPSFPIPQVDYNAHRNLPRQQTPLEAFREGQELGEALSDWVQSLVKGPERKRTRERKEKILKKFADGTITAADYRQLVKDGYDNEAAELLVLQRMIDEAERAD